MPDRTSNDVKPLKIIIIGADIGGLALAQLLMSAPGTHVTCYERSDGVNDHIGYCVMLTGSTLAMLKRKLTKEVWAHLALSIGEAPEGGEKVEFFKGNGDKMFVWDSNPMKDQFAVSRWQLKEALLHQAKPILRVRHAFERYELLPKGGVRVYFSNGTADDCDLIVGADGSDSNVKKQFMPNAGIKDVGMAIIYFKIPLTEESMGLLGSPVRSMNPLIPYATRYTSSTIEPDESFIMFGGGSPVSNFDNRRCAPNNLRPAELKAEVISRTSKTGIHPRFAMLAQMACIDTAHVFLVRKCDVVHPWVSQNVTLLGDAVFNMSNILSRGANCALLDAVNLAEHITSPTYDRSSSTSLDAYVKDNIDRRQNERYRSCLLQKAMFSCQNRFMEFLRNKTLPLALRKIDDRDREEHNVAETWVANEQNDLLQSERDPEWVEELRWEEIYEERHGIKRIRGS
ncbi:hypothetical protein VC83_03470 [Pseudogymnoascus destructans]|uniref:FAD-binding domain-containing protein n=1 Tax=Pseudogymnoascus destructans TaxID=655981 RepID=A0A177AGS3_9PEZI|nr:uncharacterized protein VC83_03470 [Pseudogymnoascus destructans]OAF60374.1 hypothetical protein VC83_03470 [Pseudogymnoascus destructans]